MHLKGEKWLLRDGRIIIVIDDLANTYLKILNENGKLEVITESYLKERIHG